MTREESWQVEGVTLTILRHVTSLGYTVSVFRFPPPLLGTRPACVEMHALDLSEDPPGKHVARLVDGEGGDLDYRCACLLAAQTLWQCDFFSKHIVTAAGIRQCFVLAFLHVSTRRVCLSPCSFKPDRAWMAAQAEAFLAHAKE